MQPGSPERSVFLDREREKPGPRGVLLFGFAAYVFFQVLAFSGNTWVWVKITPGIGPQVVVHASIYPGSILGYLFLDPHVHGTVPKKRRVLGRTSSRFARSGVFFGIFKRTGGQNPPKLLGSWEGDSKLGPAPGVWRHWCGFRL